MVFQKNDSTYFMTVERMGIMTLRFSMGYVSAKNEVYELSFDI